MSFLSIFILVFLVGIIVLIFPLSAALAASRRAWQVAVGVVAAYLLVAVLPLHLEAHEVSKTEFFRDTPSLEEPALTEEWKTHKLLGLPLVIYKPVKDSCCQEGIADHLSVASFLGPGLALHGEGWLDQVTTVETWKGSGGYKYVASHNNQLTYLEPRYRPYVPNPLALLYIALVGMLLLLGDLRCRQPERTG